jgi:hypothetical protein
LVPILIAPAEESFSMVLPAAKVGFSATVGLVVVVPPPPHALRLKARAAEAATSTDFRRVINAFMTFLSLVGRS